DDRDQPLDGDVLVLERGQTPRRDGRHDGDRELVLRDLAEDDLLELGREPLRHRPPYAARAAFSELKYASAQVSLNCFISVAPSVVRTMRRLSPTRPQCLSTSVTRRGVWSGRSGTWLMSMMSSSKQAAAILSSDGGMSWVRRRK